MLQKAHEYKYMCIKVFLICVPLNFLKLHVKPLNADAYGTRLPACTLRMCDSRLTLTQPPSSHRSNPGVCHRAAANWRLLWRIKASSSDKDVMNHFHSVAITRVPVSGNNVRLILTVLKCLLASVLRKGKKKEDLH